MFAKAVGGDSELWEAEVGKAIEATLSTLSTMHSVHMVVKHGLEIVIMKSEENKFVFTTIFTYILYIHLQGGL